MEKLLINRDTKEEIVKNLKKFNIEIVLTKENTNILKPLSNHPDMLVHYLPNGDLVVERDNYDYYLENFKNFNIIKSEKSLDSKYPKDISLNGANFKNLFIHNLKYTDKNLLDYYSKNNYKLINVKQGYTKCNLLIGKNVLITSDRDIYNKVRDFEKILLIDHKQINLPGFNYGFIGGTSGLVNEKILFTGSLKNHSSCEDILEFLDKNNEDYVFLSEDDIIDYGSILYFKKI